MRVFDKAVQISCSIIDINGQKVLRDKLDDYVQFPPPTHTHTHMHKMHIWTKGRLSFVNPLVYDDPDL